LFAGFLSVGLCGFGGVLPWARRMVVDQRRWMSAAEFADVLGLCQFLPGPNIINVSIALGARYHGAIGSLTAFAGLMAAPMTIVLSLALVYGRFGALPAVHDAFAGLAAAASALLLATALKLAAPLRRRPEGMAVALATVVAIAWFRFPLPVVLAVMAPLSIGLAWRFRT
jgi:chromate transporter